MLQTIAIRGYRSLREVILPLAELTVVTGANGTGKSSIYRALRLLADCGRGQVIGSLAVLRRLFRARPQYRLQPALAGQG
ncbi:AAA family ATPase, partial [Mycolicibacterium fortuitum]|uniref:AAA family ATPase n=1 Tax=Mycolicibacterium fortuitum TaxID=1766 RepID=UPI001F4855D0